MQQPEPTASLELSPTAEECIFAMGETNPEWAKAENKYHLR